MSHHLHPISSFDHGTMLNRSALVLLFSSTLAGSCDGFAAYAPNFITKIIEEQTGIEPKGLLQISSLAGDDSVESTTLTKLSQEDVGVTPKEAQWQSKIVKTRFPPEPNGYLHLGHAKAVSFNFAVARMFGGVCHMRLDDTNPSKEDREYVESILEDVRWIQDGLYEGQPDPWDGKVRKTSDYFDLIYECAVALINSGDAYVDSLSAEEMKEYRGTLTEPGRDSPYRSRSVEENLELFQDMKDGKFPEGAHVLRAKIDMSSPNINMRDPTLYRIKHEPHQETGDKWCIYPMYDFSHPISDAVEDITHSLCTLEFEDHRPFYDWTIEKLLPTGLITSQPQQIEFSRLNVQSTVLSKRKLIQLVQDDHVNGWDDPRMPTLSGFRRRGVPPAALRLFCERMGISKADSNIDLTVLEDCIRETMDASCPRAFCVLNPLKVTVTNWAGCEEDFQVDRHPKEDMGTRTITFGSALYIERSDFFDMNGPEGEATGGQPPKGFKRLLPNGRVRLRYAYVVECQEVVRDPATGEPIEINCAYIPDTRAGATPQGMPRVSGIIHWVNADDAIRCTINQYDRLFAVDEPGRDSGDFLKDLNPNSLVVLREAVVDRSVATEVESFLERARRNDKRCYLSSLSYQFERIGYFALDKSVADTDSLTFNRVVTLRDTWGVRDDDRKESTRTRGNGVTARQSSKPNQEVMEDVRRVALRAATILNVEPHPDAEGLLLCFVDCGDASGEPRTVVAGLAGKIHIEDLIGKKVVAVTNLKPAKMRGIESQAMLLAATNGGEGEYETVELLQVPDDVPNGELLCFEGKDPSVPDEMLKSKGALKAFERAKECLQANEVGEASYVQEGKVFRLMTSAGPVRTASLRNAIIQ
jgi:glutaminyl-tRNA synthetase